MTLLAYPGGAKQKSALLAEIRKHAAADKLSQGNGYFRNGKMCSVGCALVSLGHADDPSNHALLGEITGYGEPLEHLNDGIFESLPHELMVAWPERFKSAARPGADLSLVHWHFMAFVVRETLERPEAESVKDACWPVVELLDRAAAGGMPTNDEWAAAGAAAWTAARAAAWAAESAAASAAESAAQAAWGRYAAKLIELIEAAPVGEKQ